jgi:hypothetical protein
VNTTLIQYANRDWLCFPENEPPDIENTNLVLCFGDKDELLKEKVFPSLKNKFPNADIVISSTAGEIFQRDIPAHSIIAATFEFSGTKVNSSCVNVRDYKNSFEAGLSLRNKIRDDDLCYILVLSDGAWVNGSELVMGFNEKASRSILITGGLAGDGLTFSSTLVGLNEEPSQGNIVMVGFYGKRLVVKFGSQGGWETFGLEKIITKSTGNVLSEIGNSNALELYKKYLGPEAKRLPNSALFFPLSVMLPGSTKAVVRTILSIDEQRKTMIFAGDVPENSKIRFMMANTDKLVLAAAEAAGQVLEEVQNKPDFALLISCVGRKLVLGSRNGEELDAIRQIFGEKTKLAGFYSYGEISPFTGEFMSQLHNQTMTITSFYEIP